MFNFNANERITIAFLAIMLLLGSFIHYYKIKNKEIEFHTPTIIEKKATSPAVININTAEEKELISLEGIGPALAERIVSHRNTNGPFVFKEDIMRIKGVGPKKFDKIKDSIVIEN